MRSGLGFTIEGSWYLILWLQSPFPLPSLGRIHKDVQACAWPFWHSPLAGKPELQERSLIPQKRCMSTRFLSRVVKG